MRSTRLLEKKLERITKMLTSEAHTEKESQKPNDPKYIKPQGLSLSGVVRITLKEWNDVLNEGWLGDSWEQNKVFCYQGFTLYQDMVLWGYQAIKITEGIYKGQYCDDYREAIDIYLPYKRCNHRICSRHMKFGPYKRENIARDKALNFLVEHHLIEILA